MKKIFESKDFSNYSVRNLNEATSKITDNIYYSSTTTVFLSHKHDDLHKLKNIIGFLESNYNVKVYIDSKDTSLPTITSGETATRIKDRIKKCNKFILFATDGAIESKWCNWELGFGDAIKATNLNLALFPMKEDGKSDSLYKGNEYMSIYPYICYYNGTEKYTDGSGISRGYYVRTQSKNGNTITPLSKWLK